MERKVGLIGYLIIASAIIWGLVIVGCSYKLSGTECYQEIQTILVLGAAFHLLFIWGPLGAQLRKTKKEV